LRFFVFLCFLYLFFILVYGSQQIQNTRFGEYYTCSGCETKLGRVIRIFVTFQDRPMLSKIIQKVSARAFHWYGWTSTFKNYQHTKHSRFGFKPNTGIAFPKPNILFSLWFNRSWKNLTNHQMTKNSGRVRYKQASLTASSPESCSLVVGRLWKTPAIEKTSHETFSRTKIPSRKHSNHAYRGMPSR